MTAPNVQQQGMQRLIFASYTDRTDRDRKNRPGKNWTYVGVPGCSLQPFKVVEEIEETDYARLMWKCLAPAVAAAISLPPNGMLFFPDLDPVTGVHLLAGKAQRLTITDPDSGQQVDCAQLQVLGTEIFTDVNSGAVDHVTVHCKSEVG